MQNQQYANFAQFNKQIEAKMPTQMEPNGSYRSQDMIEKNGYDVPVGRRQITINGGQKVPNSDGAMWPNSAQFEIRGAHIRQMRHSISQGSMTDQIGIHDRYQMGLNNSQTEPNFKQMESNFVHYATLPSKKSAFRPIKPPRKCNINNSELEEYAKQYEDLYTKRMMYNGSCNSNIGSSASNISSNTPNTLHLSPSASNLGSNTSNLGPSPVPKNIRHFRKQSSDWSKSLPRPNKVKENNNFVDAKKLFEDLDKRVDKSNNVVYSTMSLPRKMPVKKLVSVFNSQIEKETGQIQTKPVYSTLQRRLRFNKQQQLVSGLKKCCYIIL